MFFPIFSIICPWFSHSAGIECDSWFMGCNQHSTWGFNQRNLYEYWIGKPGNKPWPETMYGKAPFGRVSCKMSHEFWENGIERLLKSSLSLKLGIFLDCTKLYTYFNHIKYHFFRNITYLKYFPSRVSPDEVKIGNSQSRLAKGWINQWINSHLHKKQPVI